MAKVSISKAARLAGISRGTFYKNYLNKGVVSISKDSGGRKFIETSELLRVFGSLKGDTSEQAESEQVYTDKQVQVPPVITSDSAKDIEIRLLREQLQKSEGREQRLLTQIDKLTDTVKLLESPKHPRLWYQFWK